MGEKAPAQAKARKETDIRWEEEENQTHQAALAAAKVDEFFFDQTRKNKN